MAAKSSTTRAATPSAADKAAVAGVPRRIVEAWAAYDADAFANVFVADGIMILPGLYRKGRADIRAYMKDGFAGPYQGTQVTGEPLDVKFLSRDSAVIVTEGGVLAPGEKTVAPERAVRASWVVVKRDGEWSLAVYQNGPK